MTGLTMVGGAGMNCEGDSCAIPGAAAVSGTTEPAADSGTTEADFQTPEHAGVSAE
ncbi:hypothetical protein N1028_09415 [Herbiconiux sp. CPCC 203407]|uniref:Uncharacterized protein n=1 Tax=Herbiconiux oxytropis TaxID=2970915 RepID=A0AA42BV66_9MICO|nr:hypothetical protein [Herbiconiux oxytropis]MCS5720536.1 hypothetical protein [Herbiconiux oxytropis]MCS5726109.1 hypothetical protein [Herbiconiux oxytropis]